jgi:hypothetical protein
MRTSILLFLILLFAFPLVGQRELAQEKIPKSEARATAKIVDLLKERLDNDYPEPERMERDAHPKQHGLVKAEFIVVDDIPEVYRVGIFAEAKKYQSWIRYSNLSPGNPDIKKDSRGMAIKVMGVLGTKILEDQLDAQTQDFVFMSTQQFVTKNVKGFGGLLGSINKGVVFAGLHFLTHPRLVGLFLKVHIQVANLFDVEWGSTTPYLLGEGQAVKYAVLPRVPTLAKMPAGDNISPNYLRERMVTDLKAGEVLLDLYIQPQVNARKMPIEDPRKVWSRELSPFIHVATIRVLKQEFDKPEQDLYGDNLSFTPWHALPVHRPLGGLNRGRKVIYDTMSPYRHNRNDEKMFEPKEWKAF